MTRAGESEVSNELRLHRTDQAIKPGFLPSLARMATNITFHHLPFCAMHATCTACSFLWFYTSAGLETKSTQHTLNTSDLGTTALRYNSV